jgi:protein ImuB
MYVFLPSWPIDRRRRSTKKPSGGLPSPAAGAPADEPPFATVVVSGGRRLVAAVNPAAAAAGLAPGMPLADALAFVPTLATAAAEPAEDAAALTRLAEWCGRYSPWTAPDFGPGGDSDGIKIEITGCAHLWEGGEAQLVADLARRLLRQNIAHRIAVAGTLGAAWALAHFAAEDGAPALPAAAEERQALAALPIEALRLDPAIVAGLRRVGLRRVGELYPMPRDALARRFGEAVAHRLDQALGDMPEPLSPLGDAPVRRVRLSFAEPIADPADLARAIERLVADLVGRLAREGMGARRLDLAFHRVDGRVEHVRLGTARPSRDPRHLAGLLAAKLETVDPGLGVEDMILALFAAEKLPPEQAAFRGTPNEAAADGIAPLLDRLGARLGPDALSRIEPHASHIPERASMIIPVSAKQRGKLDVIPGRPKGPNPESMNTGLWNMDSGFAAARLPGMTGKGLAGNGSKPPRPVRLFIPPEPIEAAWVLPDDPPFRFAWRRRAHRVRRADGPERIAEEWWAEEWWAEEWWAEEWWTEGSAMAAGAIRDYYRVEDEAGRRFWLFRAGLPGNPPPRWFVHGIFA